MTDTFYHMRATTTAVLVLAIATATTTVTAAQHLPVEVQIEIAVLERAGPPRVFEDWVVFSYEQTRFARYVAAAFEHEGYRELHVFQVKKREERSDLFVLPYPVDPRWGTLRYRLVVDGVWMSDPNAVTELHDANGIPIAGIALEPRSPRRLQSPVDHGDGTFTFLFPVDGTVYSTVETVDRRRLSIRRFDQPRVTLVGSFNGWDPFRHRLQPAEREGFYQIRVPAGSGIQYYYFLVDGERVLDPINQNRARDLQTDTLVSVANGSR